LVVSLFERSMCTQPLSQGKYESICVESYLYLHCKFKHYNGVDNILDVRAIALFFGGLEIHFEFFFPID
jgi:hypothetical protein